MATALKASPLKDRPLVAEDRASFLQSAEADIIVLDIPLLFETGGNAKVDATVVVFTDEATQRDRVLARGTMSSEQFELIKSKQMPSDEKRARADYTIETNTLEHARAQVKEVVQDIRKGLRHA